MDLPAGSSPEGVPVASTRGLLSRSTAVGASLWLSAVALGLAAVVSARLLGPEGRGQLVLVLVATTLLLLVTSAGVHVAARILLPVPDNGVQISTYLGLGLCLCAVQAVACLVVDAVVLDPLGVNLTGVGLALAVAYGTFQLAVLLTREGLQAIDQTTRAARNSVLASSALVLAVGALWLSDTNRLEAFLAVLAGAGLLEALLDGGRLLRIGGGLSLDRPAARALLRVGRGGLALGLSQAALVRGDRLLIGAILGTTAVGIYSAAATLTELVALGAPAVAQATFHSLVVGSASPESLVRIRHAVLGVTALLLVVLGLVAGPLVELLFGPDFAEAATIVRWLLPSVLLWASFHLDAFSLAARGKASAGANAALAGLVIMVGLDLLILRTFELEGAAVAATAGYLVAAVIARLSLRPITRR